MAPYGRGQLRSPRLFYFMHFSLLASFISKCRLGGSAMRVRPTTDWLCSVEECVDSFGFVGSTLRGQERSDLRNQKYTSGFLEQIRQGSFDILTL
jgi:hypothetical protein